MGKETVLLLVFSLNCFVASVRRCKLCHCDFERRFEQDRPTCRGFSEAVDESISNRVATAKEDLIVSTTTTGETSDGNIMGIDCLEITGDKTFQIKNGSSTFNANCTRRITCINGEIHVDGEYNCSSNAVCKMKNEVRKCHCISGYHGDGEICTKSSNCLDIFDAGYNSDGVYSIKPSNWHGPSFDVYCNMSQGGGWTVFQRRVNGSVDFYRDWTSYKHGFGQLDHEFWLGNDKLFYLTNQGNYILRIDMVGNDGFPYYAEYDMFRVNDESDNYRLSLLGVFSGTAGNDALRTHLNLPFSTFDRDNDDVAHGNCAITYSAAWWFWACCDCNLNGDYHADLNDHDSQLFWNGLPGGAFQIKYTEMKIKPRT